MVFGVLRGGPAWRARLPVPPLPLLKAMEEPLRMQDRPGLAALLFDNKADLSERLRTIDIGAQLRSELWRTVANAAERSTRELQNQWSAEPGEKEFDAKDDLDHGACHQGRVPTFRKSLLIRRDGTGAVHTASSNGSGVT